MKMLAYHNRCAGFYLGANMDDNINFLVTVLYYRHDTLLRCAVKVKREDLPGDCAEYPMEPENRDHIHSLLPAHVRSCGPVVAVETLFEIHAAKPDSADDFRKIRHCIGLLNSMVRGGERHSDTSARMTVAALEAIERMEQPNARPDAPDGKERDEQALPNEVNNGRTLAEMVMRLGERMRDETTPAMVRQWFADNQPFTERGVPMLTVARGCWRHT